MSKLITCLTISLSLVGSLCLPATKATAQRLENRDPQRIETSALRSNRAEDLFNLRSTHYTVKDIDGKEYKMDELIASGKIILIDFSTLECKACWELHESGALEKLYAKYGPQGTDQIEVFWVEAKGASKSEIQTPNKDWSKDSKGNPVPYAICSDEHMCASMGIYETAYPILILVGAGNKAIDCSDEVRTTDPDFKAFGSLLDLFMKKEDKPQAVSFSGVTDLYVGETHTMRLSYATVAPVTEVVWTAPDGVTLEKVSDTEYKVTATKIGSYDIEVTLTNANGNTTSKVPVTVSKPIATYPFICGMDVKDKLDKGWRSIDHDGDGFGFDSFMGKGLVARLDLDPEDYTEQGAEKSADCLISWGTFLPMLAQDTPEGVYFKGEDNVVSNNELRSAPLEIPADAVKPTFSCYIKAYLYDKDKENSLKVCASELNGKPVELLVQKVGDSWTQISADLSAYKGKTILLSLIPEIQGPSAILVDQLQVSTGGSTDVQTPTFSVQTTLYPNPATDYVTIRTTVGSTIELLATDGTKLSTRQATSEETTMALSQLPAGRYLVQITSLDGGVVCRSLVIK